MTIKTQDLKQIKPQDGIHTGMKKWWKNRKTQSQRTENGSRISDGVANHSKSDDGSKEQLGSSLFEKSVRLGGTIEKQSKAYKEKDVLEFLKEHSVNIIKLENQLINDFQTPLSVTSAKRFIHSRIKQFVSEFKEKLGKGLT